MARRLYWRNLDSDFSWLHAGDQGRETGKRRGVDEDTAIACLLEISVRFCDTIKTEKLFLSENRKKWQVSCIGTERSSVLQILTLLFHKEGRER